MTGPRIVFELSSHAEVQHVLRGGQPIVRACRLCLSPIGLVERDYHRAGICGNCATQIVNWYAEAHGDGVYGMCGLANPNHYPPRYKKKKAISATLRVKVWRRDGFRCVKCGSEDDLECDHIVPESRGGPTTLENLQTLCGLCNCRKGNRIEAPAVEPQSQANFEDGAVHVPD